MTKHEAARLIVEHDGVCFGVSCDDCCIGQFHTLSECPIDAKVNEGSTRAVDMAKEWLASHPEEPAK